MGVAQYRIDNVSIQVDIHCVSNLYRIDQKF